ncbi:MAG: hypothetical protein WBD93_20715 [Acidobacteriaceae bacterium]
MATGIAAGQNAVPAAPPVAPHGYTLRESIDLGGRTANIAGSGAMYDTMVNLESGPRVLGETFELHALPGEKHVLVDSLSAFSNGWGGDPDDFSRLDFYKGNLYDFSGTFVRDRQYFDYDLLGNPNIPSGQSLPIGPSTAPTGSYAWPQVNQSPFLYNTVRRRTNAHLTLRPVSEVSYQAGYAQDVFQGPSLTPSGYQFAGSYTVLLQEMQRNSTDDFFGEIDWKPVPQTRLTFEEQVDHYKEDSYFTMDPSYFQFQEADGAKVALLSSYDSLTPAISCNSNSVGTTPNLSAPQTPGGLPVINSACGVITSYFRSQPTRILYPTEIFRFQSSSLRNISMNGDVRYTDANMNLPNYYENFEGLAATTRYQTYTATASAKREVTAIDYAIEWRATRKVSFSDQVSFSSVQQPGISTMTSETTVATPSTAGNETINNTTLTTKAAAAGASTLEGSGAIGTPVSDFFGQRYITNDVTGSWEGWSRATLSLTYRHRNHVIAEGIPHGAPLPLGATGNGTVTINENGGVFSVAVRPTERWNIEGSVEVLYADNVFTPVAPRQEQHYRFHALYRPRDWATLTGAFNDMELHNNTNNNQADIVPPFTGSATGVAYAGPLDHVAHTRIVALGAELSPNEHYALDLNYAYSDVYTSTNICYLGGAASTLPAASTLSGTACPATAANRGNTWDFGPTKDFMDAPTNSLQAAVTLSPVKTFHTNIGYNLSAVDGSRFYNDARDVAGSLHSTYQSPFVALAWTVRPGFIWNARYNYYGYGEGGPSGASYCTTAGPTPTTPSTVVPCNSPLLAGLQTGLTLPNSGETAPRTFHANIVTVGFHYEF